MNPRALMARGFPLFQGFTLTMDALLYRRRFKLR